MIFTLATCHRLMNHLEQSILNSSTIVQVTQKEEGGNNIAGLTCPIHEDRQRSRIRVAKVPLKTLLWESKDWNIDLTAVVCATIRLYRDRSPFAKSISFQRHYVLVIATDRTRRQWWSF